MPKKVRVGIVGSGFASKFHIESWLRVPQGVNIELVGITSLEPDKAKEIADAHEMEFFDTLAHMLSEPSIDVVDCCVPDYAHEQVAVAAAKSGKDAVVEKLLTGYFGTNEDRKKGRLIGFEVGRELMFKEALASADRMQEAFNEKTGISLMYAENWVYAPAVEKTCELMAQSPGTRALFIDGEESHRGSHSPAYGTWTLHGSGSASGKLCHPIGSLLRLKYEEGIRVRGQRFRPVAVNARTTHYWKDIPSYANLVGDNIKTEIWKDAEDGIYALVSFDDGTIHLVRSNEYSVGGVLNTLRVDATDQRHRISLAPNPSHLAYAASSETFGTGPDAPYITEKADQRAGHSFPAPDEVHDLGYHAEFENFARHVALGEPLKSDFMLARDSVSICYGALLSAERKGAEVTLNN